MPLFPQQLLSLAELVIDQARNTQLKIATAESCTGGLIGACLTEIAGSSDVFDRGFITYSNDSKMAQLNVSRKTLLSHGAVSPETALEMAKGALSASGADIALSVTGIAGPGGGSAEKPVGLVYIGIAIGENDKTHVLKHNFTGDRSDIRLKTVEAALIALKKEIENL